MFQMTASNHRISLRTLRFNHLSWIIVLGFLFWLGLDMASAQTPAPAPPPAIPVATETAAAAVQVEEPAESIWAMLEREMGAYLHVFVVLSVITLSLVILFFFTIRRGTVVSDQFMNAADALIRKQDYLGLVAVCNRSNECIARVTHRMLDFATKNPTASFDEVRDVTETEGNRQASLIQGRVNWLADIATIAPLIGLLGTVTGMIGSFKHIASKNFAGAEQVAVAAGVGQALLTTAAGLIVAIPAVVFYSYYRGKAQKMISELESGATQIMAVLSAQYKRAASRAARAAEQHPQTMPTVEIRR